MSAVNKAHKISITIGDEQAWAEMRRQREQSLLFSNRDGIRDAKPIKRWRRFIHRIHFGAGGLHIPFIDRFMKNQTTLLKRTQHVIESPKLPSVFDGYRILHLSDLHFGAVHGIAEQIAKGVENNIYDAIMITGDFVDDFASTPEMLEPHLQVLLSRTRTRDGIFAVLGNHDSYRDVAVLRKFGMTVLINSAIYLQRNEHTLMITGTDDPSYFYDDAACKALQIAHDGFKIVLVHSADLADIAATAGANLYLCGHTHGGQICLPGGVPILLDFQRFRQFGRGRLRYDEMHGITSHGAGPSGIPYRINCPGEIGEIILKTAPPSA